MTYRNYNNGIDVTGTDRNCLVRWDPAGRNGRFLTGGGDALCTGKPHGIKIAVENGTEYMYHANVESGVPGKPGALAHNSGKLTKTTMEGEIVWQIQGPFGQAVSSTVSSYRPSWWAVNQPGPYIYLTDGYGSFNIYVFTRDGRFLNRTFGGPGTAHGRFANPHGITFDPRSGELAVTDRGNGRIEFFEVDAENGDRFAYTKTATVAHAALPRGEPAFAPCNFRVLQNASDPALVGFAVVPALEGPVAILDQNNTVVSVVDVAGLIGGRGSKHPHDAIFVGRSGDIAVGTWNLGFVSYWKRL